MLDNRTGHSGCFCGTISVMRQISLTIFAWWKNVRYFPVLSHWNHLWFNAYEAYISVNCNWHWYWHRHRSFDSASNKEAGDWSVYMSVLSVTVFFCAVFLCGSSERFWWRLYSKQFVVFRRNPVLGCKIFFSFFSTLNSVWSHFVIIYFSIVCYSISAWSILNFM